MNINLVAIDLAKDSFAIRGVNHTGKVLYQRQVSRGKVMKEVLNFPRGAIIAMEACSSAHYWGRLFKEAGFEVRLIPPQYVKPFVKSQKNDQADAEGIAEAASRATMRFVAVKRIEQQDIQSVHRVRERHIKERTALMNELRGLLMEYGVTIPQGRAVLGKYILHALEVATVTDSIRSLARELYQELLELEKRLDRYTGWIEIQSDRNDICKRLMTIPGVGAITASALYAAVSHMDFKNGRELAAFLGLVPRQNSTGGKAKLGRITKRGDKYVRKLLVHGGRSQLLVAHKYTDRYNSWVKTMRDNKGYTKGAVAVANRNARIAWAIMSSDASFRHEFVPTKSLVH